MPELPEVETVARGLRGAVVGRRVVDAELRRPSIVRFPDATTFCETLVGARLLAVERRGKYLLLPLGLEDAGALTARDGDGAAEQEELVVHLGMTGHLDVCAADAPERPHTHLRLRLDDGDELRFADTRRFGRLLVGPRALLHHHGVLPRLGVEPLSPEFTAQALDAVLRTTRRSVKAALLDQRGVAGLGNIYVDEACFRARVRPSRRCSRLTRSERQRLHEAIVRVLEIAVGNRGTTFDDFRDVFDVAGDNRRALLVYGRGGQPCLRCGTVLRRTVIGGRGTVHCPLCQP